MEVSGYRLQLVWVWVSFVYETSWDGPAKTRRPKP
jgi:hypothetical protein